MIRFRQTPIAFILFATILATLGSCGRRQAGEAGSSLVGDPVGVERFDSAVALYASLSPEGRDSLIERYKPVLDLMGRIGAGDDGDSIFSQIAQTRYFNVFFPDVTGRIRSLDSLQTELGLLRQLLPAQVDSLSFPSRVFAIVTPYDQSILLSDTIMLIGLNHYLGADYQGYEGFDDYRRQLKILSQAPIDVAEALVYSSRPFEGSSASTALQRMVYEGAVVAAVNRSLPDRSIAEILGYTPRQMQWLSDNESEIWRKMVADNLIYSHDRAVAERLVMPAPFTSVISPDAPGRAGRYIGYRIAETYLKNNPQSKPSDLLSSSLLNSDDLLLRAGYRK